MATRGKSTTDVAVPAANLFDQYMQEQDFVGADEMLEEGAFVSDKDVLVGIPFLILGWQHVQGNSGLASVRVDIVLQNGDRAAFADFSSGIRLQLEDITRKANGWEKDTEVPEGTTMDLKRPMYVPFGLRVSEYSYHDSLAGTNTPAKTYYINPAQR